MSSKEDYSNILDEISNELQAHGITHMDVAYASRERSLNGGDGYSQDKVRNMLRGKTAIHVDLLTVMGDLIEEKLEELRQQLGRNPSPAFDRIMMLRSDRIELENALLKTGEKVAA